MLLSLEELAVYMDHIILWYRYIDDVIAVWDESFHLLQEFLNVLNVNKFNLKCTLTSSMDSISFLNVEIHKCIDGHLTSTLY